MVPVEETPQEEDGSAMVEDEGSFHSDAGVSSTAASPKPIPIPAPMRASVHTQQAVKGCGTKNHPYELDFAPAVHRGHGISPETRRKQRDH